MRFDSFPGATCPAGCGSSRPTTRRTRGKGPGQAGRACRRRSRCTSSPCRSVHTFGMRFALDLIWLDRGGARGPRGYRACRRGGCGPACARGRCSRCAPAARTRSVSAQRDGRDAEHDQDRAGDAGAGCAPCDRTRRPSRRSSPAARRRARPRRVRARRARAGRRTAMPDAGGQRAAVDRRAAAAAGRSRRRTGARRRAGRSRSTGSRWRGRCRGRRRACSRRCTRRRRARGRARRRRPPRCRRRARAARRP